MIVETIAYTDFNQFTAERLTDYQQHGIGSDVSALDELAEFAGRNCYQSWNRPNPATATNEGYLANILGQGHESVLEHASVTFFVEGVSRALLTELTRHRHLSFSVISQRYVGSEHISFVVPPAWRDYARSVQPGITDEAIHAEWQGTFADLVSDYEDGIRILSEHGLSKKQVREAARAVLPNCAEVKMVVTGNIRAWRDVLKKRYHVAADAEIRQFAGLVLDELREMAPNSVQDIPDLPYGS